MENNFLNATVIFPVKVAKKTVEFYRDKLGFEIVGIWETQDNSFYASVKRGNVVIEFGEGRQKYVGTGICSVIVQNIDAIYNEFKSKEIEFVGDFAQRNYGSKDFRIKDNNGNVLIVTQALKNQEELLGMSPIK